jgi:hypothetical protein
MPFRPCRRFAITFLLFSPPLTCTLLSPLDTPRSSSDDRRTCARHHRSTFSYCINEQSKSFPYLVRAFSNVQTYVSLFEMEDHTYTSAGTLAYTDRRVGGLA